MTRPVTRDEVQAIAATLRETGLDVSDGDVAMATFDIDLDAHRAQVADTVRWEVWDKKTPINGVPADAIIRNRNDIADADQVYLVLVDDTVTYIQPFVPGVEGITHMTADDVPGIADAHVVEIVDTRAFRAVTEAVRERLAPATPATPTISPATPATATPDRDRGVIGRARGKDPG